ncbi:MAG: hypothetical protein ACKO1N_05975, partial [Erythrobacter sp.]
MSAATEAFAIGQYFSPILRPDLRCGKGIFMFGKKPFGRKNAEPVRQLAPVAAAMPHPVPDPDGKLRAIPKAIFDGPQGQFLKDLGLERFPTNLTHPDG